MPDFDDWANDGSWISLFQKGQDLHFVFARGGGDCPAGCTEWDYYYVTYDTHTSAVTLEHQLLNGTKWSDDVFYWDRPTRYSINPYSTFASLLAGLHDTRWWYRQHAVHVLARLLSEERGPWHGAGEQSASHFTELKTAALGRRRESYEALIARLGDEDPDVARLALEYLRSLSGRHFPGGTASIPQWREWLLTLPER